MPDSNGFEQGGKEPMGRCVLEDRGKSGKLSLWVQDLKTAPYKVVIILSEIGKYTGMTLGSLYVDGKGKGEFKNEFDLTGLADGQGLSRVCAVAVFAGSGGEMLCPLVGYKDGSVLWKNHFSMRENERQDKIQQAAAKSPESGARTDSDIRIIPVSKANATSQEIASVNPASQEAAAASASEAPADPLETEAGIKEPFTDAAQGGSDDADPTESPNEYNADGDFIKYLENGYDSAEYGDEQDFHDSDLAVNPDEFPPPDDTAEYESQEAADYEVLSNLKEVFDNNIEITPFETKSPDEKWVRVSLREPIYLPVDYRLLMNHPFIIAAYKKYNHLIMGYITDNGKTRYILGVPGVYEPQYVNTVHHLGFTQFKTVLDKKELNPDDHGYWLTSLYMHG